MRPSAAEVGDSSSEKEPRCGIKNIFTILSVGMCMSTNEIDQDIRLDHVVVVWPSLFVVLGDTAVSHCLHLKYLAF